MKTTTLTDSWNIGQFNLTLTADLEAALLATLQPLILRWLGQRNSAVDKVLGAYTVNGDGKTVRIPNWKRNDVPFTPELAAELQTAFAKLAIPDEVSGGKDVTLAAVAEVTEKVDGGKAPKFAEEKAILARHTTDGKIDLDWIRDTVKYAGDEVNAESDTLLKAIKAYKIAALKGL